MIPRRSHRWIWVTRVIGTLLVAGLATYLSMVGLDKADKSASAVAAVLALVMLLGQYLLPAPRVARSRLARTTDVASVAVHGDNPGEIQTTVSGAISVTDVTSAENTAVSTKIGTVDVGGSNHGSIRTKVTGLGPRGR